MTEENKTKDTEQCCESIKCCGAECCDGKQVSKFLRHIADFFDKK